MRIIYGFASCTDRLYNKILGEKGFASFSPAHKYHSLMIRGLAENGADLYCISGLPINRSTTSRKLIREKDEREGGAYFHYITTLNLPVLRQLMIFCGAFFSVLRVKKEKETYAVCDCLNIATAYGVTLAARLRRIPVVSIVTDLPDMEHASASLKRINNRLFSKTDGFILLTEPMNARVNQKGKPHIVLEGHVDSDAPLPETQTTYEQSEGKKVVLYAGSLKRIYGIDNLVEGFIKADIPDAELRIYGKGNFAQELDRLAEEHPSVRFLGTRSSSEIVAEEQRASLLVNPRPVAPEYTKYSFPSKNMEYMVSGTPTLTTRLPGMPKEYEPYVYLIGDETPDSIAATLREILSKPLSERVRMGAAARDFVLKNKSNLIQAKKIMDFLTGVNSW